ncbi:MAG: phosphatidylinositol-binding protein scs2 [Thelocarpon impressellum]|nr:MAG: phosphatidylinositol-binding protein scs2 [Thelocarpon impressellum]
MSVELNPPELSFQRPFTQEVIQSLHLKNPNHDPLAFKVKTTAPKQYCVRPNSGRIEAGMEVEVQVLLQSMKEDPPPDAKCRDKFLVQTIPITADREFASVTAIWQFVEQTAKASIQEKKIRVSFLPAPGQRNGKYTLVCRRNHRLTVPQHLRNELDVPDSDPPAYSSPSSEAFTPAQGGDRSNAPVGPVSRFESRPGDSKNLGDAVRSAGNPATSTANQPSVVSSITAAVPTSSEELKAQLAEAKATIGRLTEQAKDQGLRQRKTEAVTQDARERLSAGTTGQGVPGQPQTTLEGVPVQIVAALCLLSFLLAYLFF